jgi:hypothetical protein
MRKEYDFSDSVRGRAWRRSRTKSIRRGDAGKKPTHHGTDDEPLSPAQIRLLQRRMTDVKNPIRYLLVSEIGLGFALYYNVSDDMYAMNDPSGATLFKRRIAALAVKRLLGAGIRVIRCTTRHRNGLRVPVLSGVKRRKKRHGSVLPNRPLSQTEPACCPPAVRQVERAMAFGSGLCQGGSSHWAIKLR